MATRFWPNIVESTVGENRARIEMGVTENGAHDRSHQLEFGNRNYGKTTAQIEKGQSRSSSSQRQSAEGKAEKDQDLSRV